MAPDYIRNGRSKASRIEGLLVEQTPPETLVKKGKGSISIDFLASIDLDVYEGRMGLR